MMKTDKVEVKWAII